MKKFTTFILALGIVVISTSQTGFSQNRPFIPPANVSFKVKDAPAIPKDDDKMGTKPVNLYVSNRSILDDPSTMMTKYDLQSNSSSQNRIYMFPDGKIGATAQWSHQDGGSWSDRGTGYNMFDGTNWGPEPTARIENEKIGWPSYAPLGADGEIVVSHSMLDGLKVCTRATKGQGAWTQTILPGPPGAVDISWPRMVTNGTNHTYVHVISLTYVVYEGLDLALLYSRSLDGGQSWDIQNIILDGMTSAEYLGFAGDTYGWAEPKGDTICFYVGDSWNDQFIMKSTDNGNTWTKTIIWNCAYKFWAGGDSVPTFWCPDGTSAVELDNNGMAHVVFGLQRASGDASGGKYWVPYTDGVIYWNEYMPELPQDLDPETLYNNGNYIGWVTDTNVFYPTTELLAHYYTSMTSNPDIVIDEDNNMFVVWAGVVPLVDPDNYWLRHIYERTAAINPDHTVLWNDSINELTSEFLQYNWTECMYPDASPTSDDKIYILFQADDLAGAYMKGLNVTGYSGQTSITENQMIVVSPLKTDLGAPGVGVNEKNKPSFSVSPNYPNPFKEFTSIGLSLNRSGNVSILVTNLIGQNLMVMDKGFVNAGSYRYMVDGSRLTPGIYFCTVNVDNASYTQKMIVE